MRRLALALLIVPALAVQGQSIDPKLTEGLKWRQIGPFRGGRSLACSGVYGKPNEFYMGTCGGGLWKTADAGETWKCVTDGFLGVGTVGAVCVSPSQPETVYIGTGERDIRGNISHGDGVYKTTDGGKTWKHVGLKDTQTIGRIVVHPKNPDVVWVAALGHIYGPNSERGVYKSTDGGTTWRRVLYESDRAGAVHITVDPNKPDVLFAATWEAWRTPYSLNSGGPGSKIWKSADGGETWKDITRNPGLPSGLIGKVGLSISPVDGNRVYAIVESLDGGIFRSDDSGATWKLMNDSREYRQRAWYYTHIHADPVEKDTVYVLNLSIYRSKDGGARFTGLSSQHGDEHDLWIDPADNKRMVNSDDGGACVTVNAGQNWTAQDFPTAQFYHVSTDNANPYRILGAQQDNSTVRIASRGASARGIGPTDWTSTAGGESGYVSAKPDDPDVVFGGSYGGDLSMINHRTGEFRSVDPWPDNPMGDGAINSRHRFQWTFPIVFSPHDPNVLYTCSQHVMKSTNLGESWNLISPDLTRNDPSTLQSSGGPITKDNTGVEVYATVFTVAESPKQRNLIWAGSDDGLVHVTKDGGKTWAKITPKGMPAWGLCSMIDASPHAAGRAFLAVDNHENDDHNAYIFRTDDFGQTWRRIDTGLPKGGFVRVVREDPVAPNMLYAGTETGLWLSVDGGGTWSRLNNNLPVVPIHDLVIKNDDLVVATHGRSFWVLDNIVALRAMAGVSASQNTLFPVKDFLLGGGGGFGGGGGRGQQAPNTEFGDNPPSGMVIDYYLTKKADKLTLEVLDSSGRTVATASSAPNDKGFQRATVRSLSYPGIRGSTGMVLWASRGGPIPAPPGTYTVRLTTDGAVATRPVRVRASPALTATDADLQAQYELARQIADRTTEANDAVLKIRDIRKKSTDAVAKHADLKGDADRLMNALTPIEEAIYQTKSRASQDPLNYPIRLNDKLGGVLGNVLGGSFRPTRQSREVFADLSGKLQVQLDALKAVMATELKSFNEKLKAAGEAEIVPKGVD